MRFQSGDCLTRKRTDRQTKGAGKAAASCSGRSATASAGTKVTDTRHSYFKIDTLVRLIILFHSIRTTKSYLTEIIVRYLDRIRYITRIFRHNHIVMLIVSFVDF